MTQPSSEDPPSAGGSPPPPPKRRKVDVEVDDSPSARPANGSADHSPPPPPPPPDDRTVPDNENGEDNSPPPPHPDTLHNDDAPRRGPRVPGVPGLDEVRPPRRAESRDGPAADAGGGGAPGEGGAAAGATPVWSSAPTNLDPQVDTVLQRIFASGLFERRDIDGRALDLLGSVSTQLALAALDDIQRRDFSTVRNKPAFIMSIFKRVIAGGGAIAPPPGPPPGGFAPTSVPASALAHLPPAVSDALQRVFTSGVCHPSQFDDRAMDILVDLAEPDAVRALSEFAAMEPGRVRNPSAFWMGLARKYKGHSRAPGGRMGPDSAGPGPSPSPGAGASYGSGFDGSSGYGRSASTGGGFSALDQRLEELASSGALPRNVLDERALEALRRLPENDGLAVLAELPEPARVRNMSAYVMGLCKKFASGEARSLSQRGNAYAGGGGYGGGGYGASGYGASGAYGAPYGGGGYSAAATGAYGGAYAPPPAPAPAAYAAVGYGVQSGAVPTSYGAPPQQQPDVNRAREVREALDAMDPAVRERFYNMTERGIITETSFDARAIGALQSMRRDEACAALDELAASEPGGRIHNISAYFMGLAKKFSRPAM